MAGLGPVGSPAPCSRSIADATSRPPDQVYIVDDDSMVRRSLSFSLATSGFGTRAFASGRDFLDEVDMLAPGCVLLDIRMPGIDGIAVLKELATRAERFAVVAMTGHGDVGTAVKAMKCGSRDFLEKPFTDAALLEVLNSLFSTLPVTVKAEGERVQAAAKVARLTPRERELLQGLVGGLSNKEVATRMNVSVRTVEMHRRNLMERVSAKSLSDLLNLARLAGLMAV